MSNVGSEKEKETKQSKKPYVWSRFNYDSTNRISCRFLIDATGHELLNTEFRTCLTVTEI